MTAFALRKLTLYIVVHCSATHPDMDIGVTELRKWHLARGFADIGYHYVIRRDGRMEAGRIPDDCIGAHVMGFNYCSVGVCMVGGIDKQGKAENNFMAAQFSTLRMQLRELSAKYPQAVILGHRDLSPDVDGDGIIEHREFIKECPCFDAIEWAKQNDFRVPAHIREH